MVLLSESYEELDKYDYHKVLELDRKSNPSSYVVEQRAKAAWATIRASVRLGFFHHMEVREGHVEHKELKATPWWRHDPKSPSVELLATYKERLITPFPLAPTLPACFRPPLTVTATVMVTGCAYAYSYIQGQGLV